VDDFTAHRSAVPSRWATIVDLDDQAYWLPRLVTLRVLRSQTQVMVTLLGGGHRATHRPERCAWPPLSLRRANRGPG
jgi:hypothetical protein